MTNALKTADFGDVQIAFRDEGNADGPALVLAHSMGFDHSQWDEVVALMPAGLRLIRYDLRGHGHSSLPPAPWSMGAMIRDAERLLDHLKIRDAAFVGLSIGGMVAQGLAVKRLDLIRVLVLSDTATKLGTKETWARLMQVTRETGLAARLDKDLSDSFTATFLAGPKAEKWRRMLARQQLDSFLGCCAAISGTDFYTTTASLRLASLIVAGADDAITPPDMVRELSELIPGAQFRLIRRCGHLPPVEQPEIFARTLCDFLKSVGHV